MCPPPFAPPAETFFGSGFCNFIRLFYRRSNWIAPVRQAGAIFGCAHLPDERTLNTLRKRLFGHYVGSVARCSIAIFAPTLVIERKSCSLRRKMRYIQRTRHPREIYFCLLRSVGAKNYGFVSNEAPAGYRQKDAFAGCLRARSSGR